MSKPNPTFEIWSNREDYSPAAKKPMLIDKLIPHAPITCILGKPGAGKTFVAINMAHCLSAGIPFHGHETQRRHVLYLSFEGAHDEMRCRCHPYKKEAERYNAVNITVHCDSDLDFLNQDDSRNVLEAAMKRLRCLTRDANAQFGTVFLDTLASMHRHSVDENDPLGMGRSFGFLTLCIDTRDALSS